MGLIAALGEVRPRFQISLSQGTIATGDFRTFTKDSPWE